MITIGIENASYKVPGSWDELTTEQLVALIRLCEKEELTYVEIQLKFFLHCVYGSVRKNVTDEMFIIKTRAYRHVLTSEELVSVLQVFDFLFDENEDGSRTLSPKLTVNHFKQVQCGCLFLHGPHDALDDITYNEFVWLQTWQSQAQENDDEWLNEFINVIYKTRGGRQNVANVRRMSRTAKTGILWFYIGTLHYLEARFPHVFSGSGDNVGNVFDNQQRIIDSLAEGDVTKKDAVRQSLLYDALYSMEMAAIRIEEMEKQNRANSQ